MSAEVCGCDSEAHWQCERHRYRADAINQLRSKETVVLTQGQAAMCPRCHEDRMVGLTTSRLGIQAECAVCSYMWWITYAVTC